MSGQEDGHKDAAEGEDGDAGGPGKGSEESADEGGDDGGTATEMADKGLEDTDEAL
jgi:hypothetical protein